MAILLRLISIKERERIRRHKEGCNGRQMKQLVLVVVAIVPPGPGAGKEALLAIPAACMLTAGGRILAAVSETLALTVRQHILEG